MPQAILITGAMLASAIGAVLAGLIIRSAIASDRHRTTDPNQCQLPEFTANPWRTLSPSIAVRGYDTPELAQEDSVIRTRSSERDLKLN